MSDDNTVQYGTDYQLTCEFTGTPLPRIKWLFNGDPVDLENNIVVDKAVVNGRLISILILQNFQPSKVGVYQCLVSNQYGSDIKSTTLYGKGKNMLTVLLG